MSNSETHKAQTRLASIVVVVAMLGWVLISWFGGMLGLPVRFAFLADLIALAAFVWAGTVLFRIWRARQTVGKE